MEPTERATSGSSFPITPAGFAFGRRRHPVGETSSSSRGDSTPGERALADDLDAELLDAGDLRRLLLYGLDREVARDLARTYLDRPLSTPETDDESGTEAGKRLEFAGALTDRWERLVHWDRWQSADRSVSTVDRWRRVIGIAVLIAALATLGAGVQGGVDVSGTLSGGANGADETDDSAAGRPGDVSVTPAPAGTTPWARLESTNEPLGVLPPGLGESGITDADALARAHGRALASRSYRWVVTYEEVVDGRSVGVVREVVRYERSGVYRVGLERQSEPTTDAVLFSPGPAYADGEYRYEPTGGADGRESVRAIDLSIAEERPFRERARAYIEWYLSASRSAITDVVRRNGRTMYRVETVGDPYPGAANARASALVDTRGMVHTLRAERDLPESDVRMVLSFRYTDLGSTTVEPPKWNGTNGSADPNRTSEADGTGGRDRWGGQDEESAQDG